jgi:probable phosphoglycerate mutase
VFQVRAQSVNVSDGNHRLVLLRHGETEWSRDRKHTGRTDIDLLDEGREQARRAANTLAHLGLNDPIVFSSPRRRALLTAELAGLAIDEVSPLLAEWDYGDYEGLTTDEIRTTAPGWLVWTHGCPGGESVDEVSARADRAVALALEQMTDRDVVFVSHGHFSRSVLTRWVEQPLSEGVRYGFSTASVAVCGFEYGVRQLSSLGLTTYRTPDIGT